MSHRTFWDGPRPADTFKCDECGERVLSFDDIVPGTPCAKCRAPLHSCRNCTYFDTAAQNECRQAIPARIEKKRADNPCTFFTPRMTVDLHGPKADTTDSSRRSFDDLFKK